MQYVKDVFIEHNTTYANRITRDFKVSRGVIVLAAVRFPFGCCRLVGVKINHGLHQVVPANPDGSLFGHNETIDPPEWYEIKSGGAVMTIKAWNLDEAFDHTITVRLVVLPKWLAYPYSILANLLENFARMFR